MAALFNQHPFLNDNPGATGIKLLYNSDNEVIAMNINAIGCGLINYAGSLEELESITIFGTQIYVETKLAREDFYHYTVTPIGLNPYAREFLTNTCTSVVLVPFLEGLDFTYNEYNALIGNTKELRRYRGVFEVDYKSTTENAAIPSNLQAILSGSATVAEVQESNYTSIGLTNSRYNGAKTSILDYGVNSAVSATTFNAATYLSSVSNTFICSQSLAEKGVKEYLFTGNDNFPTSGSRVFELDGSKLIPIRDRKIWVENNNRIFATDLDGYTITSGSLCGE